MPLGVICRGLVEGDRLLPIRAQPRGFWRCAAIGHARVRANLSIIGGRRFYKVSGNMKVARMRFFASPANLAKS
jgi:hypothetical protein